MTIREAISNVRVPLKELNADSRLTNKLIYSSIIATANVFIQRDSDALRLDSSFFQPLTCEPLEEVPAIEPCYGLRTRATIFRTVNTLPDTYTDQNGAIIGMVTTLDYTKRITLATPETIMRSLIDPNSKWDKTIYGFIRDGRFFLASARYKALNLEAAFVYDISERSRCNCENPDYKCYKFLDNKWMVPKRHERPIIESVIKDLGETYKRLTSPNVIDKNDNT